ncbi:MAG TPA: hypothetical protein DCG53_01930 [Syntrophus sp. (in: bacteria)]|nr:hypothetical protein [Syntrophus sp. (in: bacteria)]
MDPKQIPKQMFDFNKMAFQRSFSAMLIMQDQAEKMIGMWMDQNKWFPEEGKKAMEEWVKTYKKGRDDFKSKVNKGYEKMEEYLEPK